MRHVKSTATRVHPFSQNGSALRRLRKHADISQERLATVAGTTRRHYIRLENGEHLPSTDLRNRIADALGCEYGEIQAFDEDDEEAALSASPLSRDEFSMLGDLMARLGATLLVPSDRERSL